MGWLDLGPEAERSERVGWVLWTVDRGSWDRKLWIARHQLVGDGSLLLAVWKWNGVERVELDVHVDVVVDADGARDRVNSIRSATHMLFSSWLCGVCSLASVALRGDY